MVQVENNTVNLGPWIISGIALIQVWAIALYKKIRKYKISIFESGNIEIGFSNFGPTLGLLGTLLTEHKDVFIKNIKIKLIKKKDNSSHNFTWKAFRSNTISLTTDQPTSLEVVSSFLLKKDNPFKYHIVFVEESFIADMNPKIAQIPQKWLEFKKEKYNSLKEEEKIAISQANPSLVGQILYDDFIKTGKTTAEYTDLDRSFYWEACEYEIEFIIETPEVKDRIRKIFTFCLRENEIQQLRLNVVGIINHLCGFTQRWNFTYTDYKK